MSLLQKGIYNKMRKLKFRQARIAKGKFVHWHYWGYVDDKAGHFVAPLPPNTGGDSYQFTGLSDKSGKEVYEGEKFKGKQSGTIYKAVFRGGEYCLVYDSKSPPQKDYYHCSLHYGLNNLDIEVIGNIHENPELPKDKG